MYVSKHSMWCIFCVYGVYGVHGVKTGSKRVIVGIEHVIWDSAQALHGGMCMLHGWRAVLDFSKLSVSASVRLSLLLPFVARCSASASRDWSSRPAARHLAAASAAVFLLLWCYTRRLRTEKVPCCCLPLDCCFVEAAGHLLCYWGPQLFVAVSVFSTSTCQSQPIQLLLQLLQVTLLRRLGFWIQELLSMWHPTGPNW